MKHAIIGISGFFGTCASFLFGGWSAALTTFAFLVAIDYITGMIISLLGKSPKTQTGGVSSRVGIIGIIKKVFMFMLIAVGYRLEIAMNLSGLEQGIIFALIANESISILENIGQVVKLPKIVVNLIDILRGEADNETWD